MRTGQTREHICGGTLIAKDLVLTAAHCVHKEHRNAEPLPLLMIGGTALVDDPDAEVSSRFILHSIFEDVIAVLLWKL